MQRLCFDSSGQPHGQNELQDQNGSSLSGDTFSEYAARNLGFVSCAVHSNYTHVWLRPSRASDKALTGAIYCLAHACPGRVVLQTFGQNWQQTILPLGDAIDRLAEFSLIDKNFPAYQRHEIKAAPSRLQGLVELWSSLSGTYQAEPYLKLAAAQLNDRLFVVEPRDDHLCYRHFGSGIGRRTFAKEVSEGAPVETLSDTAYALKTVVSYREALDRPGEPILERISARVRSAQFPEAHLEYTRMLLPCRDAAGQELLVGTSVM